MTKAGELAAKKAKLVLDINRQFVNEIRNFAQSQQVIKIASVAPGPQIVIDDNKPQLATNIDLNQELFDINRIEPALLSHQYSLIITNQEIQTDLIESRYLGQERLFVNLDQFMYLANQQQVTFKELAGLSFVVLNEIGPWKQIIQNNIPKAKFLYQAEYDSMRELTKYTNFPFFTTNITNNDNTTYDTSDSVRIPITDNTATMTFYAAYLKSQRKIIAPLAKKLAEIWPQ